MDLMIDTSCKENKYYGRQEAKSEALAYPTKIHLVFQPEKKQKNKTILIFTNQIQIGFQVLLCFNYSFIP